ncbi:MAG: VWA domain-containing protein [Deltaproteobacteria bacterium]|nr:VWA domain-containing protein [Deltaproteobacteria bacterium]
MIKLGDPIGIYILAVVALFFLLLLLIRMLRPSKLRAPLPATEVIFKLLSIILLCLAVSDPYLEREDKISKAVALVDISDSLDETVGEELLKSARTFRSAGMELRFFPFAGSKATVGLGSDQIAEFSRLKASWSKLNIGSTNLEQALLEASSENATAALLISDGFETTGDAARILPILKSAGFSVFPLVPHGFSQKADVFRISHLYAPLLAPAQQSVEIRASVQNLSSRARHAKLKILQEDAVLFEERISVPAGKEVLYTTLSDPLQEGIKEVTAVLQPEDPEFPPVSSRVYLSAEEREKVLLLSGLNDDERHLKSALQAQAYQIEALVAGGRRIEGLEDLKRYSAVVLNNIAFGELPLGMATALEGFVKSGGGLVMIGGNRSFGLGGYKNTSVEDILPLELVPPEKEQKRLNLAVGLVLDKSASMKIENRMDFTKEAAKGVIRTLKDDDYFGIVAFDAQPFHLIEMGRVGSIRQKAIQRVDLLYPNLTTRLMGALNLARKDLERTPAGRKHMIILTDGKLPDAFQNSAYYLQMVREMGMLGITVSTFLIGMEGEPLLKQIADVGGGAFYRTRDARSLPRLFIEDVRVSTGERTQKEEGSYAAIEGETPIHSTELKTFPRVLGYVQTKPKAKADLELVAFANRKAEPLLASWKYGKGRTAAFTSDVSGRWSYHWVGWSKFNKFWSDIIESVRPGGGTGRERIEFDLRPSVEKGILILDLSVFSEISGAVKAKVTRPDGNVQEVVFDSISRGHYEARVEHVMAGKYEVQPELGEVKLTPVAFDISGELFGERKGLGFNRAFLEKLASGTNGKVNPKPEDLRSQATTLKVRTNLAHFFLGIAILLLCLGILHREVWRYRRWWPHKK